MCFSPNSLHFSSSQGENTVLPRRVSKLRFGRQHFFQKISSCFNPKKWHQKSIWLDLWTFESFFRRNRCTSRFLHMRIMLIFIWQSAFFYSASNPMKFLLTNKKFICRFSELKKIFDLRPLWICRYKLDSVYCKYIAF